MGHAPEMTAPATPQAEDDGMSGREERAHLMAQWWECPLPMAEDALSEIFAAWKQAMAEMGVPEHPGGKCPAQPCNCGALMELVTFRAYELMGLEYLDEH